MTTVTDNDYLSLRNMLAKLVLKIQHRHGGDFDDLMSEANLLFVRACHTHDSSKSRLITWVYTKVWYGLLDHVRAVAKHQQWDCEDLDQVADKPRFNVQDLLREVSGDAADIIRLIVDDDGRDAAREKRSAVVQHLLSIGWAADRIIESFREIRDALR